MSASRFLGFPAWFWRALAAGGLLLAVTSFAVSAVESVSKTESGSDFDTGKAFFHSNVVPRLAENGCLKCHARGYLRPNVLVYEELTRRLAIGDSAENNAVIYKIAHT